MTTEQNIRLMENRLLKKEKIKHISARKSYTIRKEYVRLPEYQNWTIHL